CDLKSKNAPVAQMDRASDYESAGRRFESSRARQQKQGVIDITIAPFLFVYAL
ncbi:MAG: hypothetical protein H6Q41_4933, partial [Deltaproteobacteria bacterium]|nr:hypothetical protein [Deltaproteobacteria bacterium]